jgi:carboxypeptidase Taq
VHWSHGSFGYFPTYSLGSLYAAQFWNRLKQDEPGVADDIAAGSLERVHNWLQKNVYAHGRLFTSDELSQRISGGPLNSRHFIEYIKDKYGIATTL